MVFKASDNFIISLNISLYRIYLLYQIYLLYRIYPYIGYIYYIRYIYYIGYILISDISGISYYIKIII